MSSILICLPTTTYICSREDLRRRFVKAETTLFRVRYESDDRLDKEAFLGSRNFNWIQVSFQITVRQIYKCEPYNAGGRG